MFIAGFARRRVRRWPFMFVLLACALVLGIVSRRGRAAELTETSGPGQHSLTINSQGHSWTTLVQIPAGYDPSVKSPLVLLLHGGGGSGTHILNHNNWAAKADEAGFIAVAPDGQPAAPRLDANFQRNPSVWNSGQFKTLTPRTSLDDVAFLKTLLETVSSKLAIDETKIFVVGHSNGGGMTLRCAAEMPEQIRAIATVAGIYEGKVETVAEPTPTLYIIGEKDPLLPLEGGVSRTPWGERQTRPRDAYLGAWAKLQGCLEQPTVLIDDEKIVRSQYPGERPGSRFEVLLIKGHGHAWPGAALPLMAMTMGPSVSTVHANDEIWKFFQDVMATTDEKK